MRHDTLRRLIRLQLNESLLTEASVIGDQIRDASATLNPLRTISKRIDKMWEDEVISDEDRRAVRDKLEKLVDIKSLASKHLKSLDFTSRSMIAANLVDSIYESFKVSSIITGLYEDWFYDVKKKNSPTKNFNPNAFNPKATQAYIKAIRELANFTEDLGEKVETASEKLQAQLDNFVEQKGVKAAKKDAAADKRTKEIGDISKQVKSDISGLKTQLEELLEPILELLSDPSIPATLNSLIKQSRDAYISGKDVSNPIYDKVPDLMEFMDSLDEYKGDFSPDSIGSYFRRQFNKELKIARAGGDSYMGVESAKVLWYIMNSLKKAPGVLRKLATVQQRQIASIEKRAEAPAKAPLGQIAFAGDRKGKPYEPDTDVERKLYDALMLHYVDNKSVSDEDAALMRKFLSKEWYSEVFHEPTSEVVYRGFTVPQNWKWLLRTLKMNKLPKVKGSIEKNFTYTPSRTAASSWSTSKKVAADFAEAGGREMAVIFHARVADNPGRFVAGPGGLYKVQGFEQYDSEKEAIGLGPIKVFKVEWDADY